MVLTSCWAISAEWLVTRGGNAMQYVVGVWGQWSRVSMSVRSEVGWQEQCDMPGGCCEDERKPEPRSGGSEP